jgi:hypothetical protein
LTTYCLQRSISNVNFSKRNVVAIDNNTQQVILKGRRDPATRLWLIQIVQQQIQLQQQYKFKIFTTTVPHAANSAWRGPSGTTRNIQNI